MKKLITLFIFSLIFQLPAFAGDDFYNDDNYSIKIAVNINEDKHILGKLEYTNRKPLFPLQLVTFSSISGITHTDTIVFEVLEKIIIQPKFHQIKEEMSEEMRVKP